jgi:hypothetical protein
MNTYLVGLLLEGAMEPLEAASPPEQVASNGGSAEPSPYWSDVQGDPAGAGEPASPAVVHAEQGNQRNDGEANQPKSGQVAPAHPPMNKLFVGGLSYQTTTERLREYFSAYGMVTDVLIVKDPVTQVI